MARTPVLQDDDDDEDTPPPQSRFLDDAATLDDPDEDDVIELPDGVEWPTTLSGDIPKEAVNYHAPARDPMESCSTCQHFIEEGGCELVAGLILPTGRSELFELKPGARPFTYDSTGGKRYLDEQTLDWNDPRRNAADVGQGMRVAGESAKVTRESARRIQRKVIELERTVAALKSRFARDGAAPAVLFAESYEGRRRPDHTLSALRTFETLWRKR